MPDFIYGIDPIVQLDRIRFPIFSFGADLDYTFALKARGTQMPEEAFKRFQEIGKDITKKFGVEDLHSTTYHFVKGSWLLHYCMVFGNACDFGLEYDSQQDFLDNFERIKDEPVQEYFVASYSPHNVDTKDQASCLLNLWLTWANLTKSAIDPPKSL